MCWGTGGWIWGLEEPGLRAPEVQGPRSFLRLLQQTPPWHSSLLPPQAQGSGPCPWPGLSDHEAKQGDLEQMCRGEDRDGDWSKVATSQGHQEAQNLEDARAVSPVPQRDCGPPC